jgi:hypothetical protein
VHEFPGAGPGPTPVLVPVALDTTVRRGNCSAVKRGLVLSASRSDFWVQGARPLQVAALDLPLRGEPEGPDLRGSAAADSGRRLGRSASGL